MNLILTNFILKSTFSKMYIYDIAHQKENTVGEINFDLFFFSADNNTSIPELPPYLNNQNGSSHSNLQLKKNQKGQ